MTALYCHEETCRRTGRIGAAVFATNIILLVCTGSASAQVISNVVAHGITSSAATITWTTDLPASSMVKYGLTASFNLSSALDPALTTTHSVTLNGLAANTLYSFNVVSSGSSNTTISSANFRLATLSLSSRNGSDQSTMSPNQKFVLNAVGAPGFSLSAPAATATKASGTYIAYGDSITYGAAASSTATAYPNLIASDLAASLTNRGVGGTQACDTAQTIMSNDNPPESQAPVQTLMIGINDAFIKGTGPYESVYKSCHTASLAWLAIPSTQKTVAQSCAQSGVWQADSSYLLGLAVKSSSPGSQLSCSVISYGGPLYLWYRVTDSNAGAFMYSVDGGPSQPVNSSSSTPIVTWGGGVEGVFVIRLTGLTAGSHTVLVTVTSAVVSILGVGSLNPVAQLGAPQVFVGGVIRQQYDANAAATAAYDADAAADVALLRGDGLPVYFVPVRNYVNANTDMLDGLHPIDLGHLHLRDAFESLSQFPVNSQALFSSLVTVIPTNGFNSPVTLTPSGWPAGFTATFGTNPATASSAITIAVAANVVPGPYSLTINGISGALSTSTSIPITVTAPPSFALAATAATATVGSPGTSTVTVTPANGFHSVVEFSASGWPAGITATFGTNPAAVSSTVTISVAASVAPGPYALKVTGTLGNSVGEHNSRADRNRAPGPRVLCELRWTRHFDTRHLEREIRRRGISHPRWP